MRPAADEVGLAFVNIAEPGIKLLAFYPASAAQTAARELHRDDEYERQLAALSAETDALIDELEKEAGLGG